jgi:hypothetical protein
VAGIYFQACSFNHSDWKLISVAHEEGNLNSFAAVLGNDVAIKAYREAKLPFPDGAIIAALESRLVGGKQPGLWPFPILRCRALHERSVHGQGRQKVRHDRRLGIRSFQQRRQTCRRGLAQNMLSLPRQGFSRLCLHPIRTFILRIRFDIV